MERIQTLIIGSGFGGAVMACRLAEKGEQLVVLERGRRWNQQNYPSVTGRDLLWDEDEPEQQNGWLDLRYFGDMTIAMGAAVGGGSQIYANVSVEAPRQAFEKNWPEQIDFETLKPFYDQVGRMMDVQVLPEQQWTRRTRLLQDAADAIGEPHRFSVVGQAIQFDLDWNYDLDDPFHHRHTREFVNRHGRKQGTCVHCGNCDIGCPVQAKNTLDLNYLARAENLGAEIRALQLVKWIRKSSAGYLVRYRDLEQGRDLELLADKVVVAAGSVGSTELLLRCRDQYATLPALSQALGKGWCANGDFLTPAWYPNRQISPTQGPTISAAIDFLDRDEIEGRFFVEDGGFPDLLGNLLEAGHGKIPGKYLRHRLTRAMGKLIRNRDPLDHLMPWFGQAMDASNGVFYLGRRRMQPWKKDSLRLKWDYRPSRAAVQGLADMHDKLTSATGGISQTPATWSWFRNLVTPHPLGGCNMADSPERGVVNHAGEVFGYPGLYVIDGAMVPAALGRNPSRTIAALAERAASLM